MAQESYTGTTYGGFPKQQLPFSRKTKAWGRACVDWAAGGSYFSSAPVRRGVAHMKINYDLVDSKLHMSDMAAVLNPGGVNTIEVPERVQHYPIINAYLNELEGEAGVRKFDWRAIVTNPDSVSAVEEARMEAFSQAVRGIAEDTSIDDAQAQAQARDAQEELDYRWQDIREIRANEILNHYSREQNFQLVFRNGFRDAEIVGEEIYQCDVVGGEPVLVRLNPLKLRIYKAGYSYRVEDADVLVYEDWWSPGRVLDAYYDQLTAKEVERIETGALPTGTWTEPLMAEGSVDDRAGFYRPSAFVGPEGVEAGDGLWPDLLEQLDGGYGSSLCPYDTYGNVRVVRAYWKSRRKILKVKSYDPETGDERFDFYPETYVVDTDAGEEAETFWINEAWEGTKIGADIYVNVRPRPVQYNTLDNPSRCHFGIVGTIYSVNEGRPFSLVDMMKPYSYLYDAIAYKMVDLIANNWGTLLEMDLALTPKGWEPDKWLYFARTSHVIVKNSFNEGEKGAATGKLAAGLGNASKGVVPADLGNSIQYYYTLLAQIKSMMGEVVGISPQRLGDVHTTETVGGVERATLQSSYITDWLFQRHDDTIRRTLAAFLETSKAAFRGRTKKFAYFLSDRSMRMMEVDGDEFAESDYGVVIDNSQDSKQFEQNITTLAQAALQNQVMDFTSIMKLYSSRSLGEKTRIVEAAERRVNEMRQEQAQQAAQMQQQQLESQERIEQAKLDAEAELRRLDNETKVRVAEINSQAEWLRFGQYTDGAENTKQAAQMEDDRQRAQLEEDRRQFDANLAFKREELRQKTETDRLKAKASAAAKTATTTTTTTTTKKK